MSDAILQLFRSCKIDNDRHMSNFEGLTQQNAYYDGLTKAQFTVRADRVGDSILLSKPYNELMPYIYGRISFDSEFWYYFSVSGLESESLNKTWLRYSIDCWETARYQLNARLATGRIMRTSNSVPTLTPYQPQHLREVQLKDYKDFGYIFYYYTSEGNKGTVCYIPGNQLDFEDILNQNFLASYGLNAGDIKGFWLTPFKPANIDNLAVWMPLKPVGDMYREHYECVDAWNGIRLPIKIEVPAPVQLQTSRTYITDLRGSEVFRPELGVTYDSYFNATLDVSATACKWTCDIMSGEDHNVFTIPCEPVDLITDAFTEYSARQRQADIDTRRVQTQRQLVEGIASAGQSVAFGSAGGPLGSAAGGVGAIVGAGITYGFNRHYASKEQAITDATYTRAKDELSLVGGTLVSIGLFNRSGVIREDWDEYTAKRVRDDVQAFGQYVSISTDDMEAYYQGKLTADVEVIGVPDDWKGQIKMRFAGGVDIVN